MGYILYKCCLLPLTQKTKCILWNVTKRQIEINKIHLFTHLYKGIYACNFSNYFSRSEGSTLFEIVLIKAF